MTLRFNLSEFEINGEWDENSRLLLVEDLGGTITLRGKVMGVKFNSQAMIETSLNNLIILRLKSVDGVPGFIVPWVIKLIMKFNRNVFKDEAFIIRKDNILIDPNILFGNSLNGKVLIQPKVDAESSPEKIVPKLRDRIVTWAKDHGGELAKDIIEMVLIVPDLTLLLIKLMKDQRVPVELKLKITLAVAYVVSPIDLIPEMLGNALGFIDDTLAMAVLIAGLIEEIPNEIIYDNWNGRPDVLELMIKGKNMLFKILPINIGNKLNSLFGISKAETAVSKEEVKKEI